MQRLTTGSVRYQADPLFTSARCTIDPLVDGVVLTPGAVGTLPELQQAGFHYVK